MSRFLFVLSYPLDCLFHSCRPCLLCACVVYATYCPCIFYRSCICSIAWLRTDTYRTFIFYSDFSYYCASFFYFDCVYCACVLYSVFIFSLPIAPIVPALSSELSTAPDSVDIRILPLCCISHLSSLLLFLLFLCLEYPLSFLRFLFHILCLLPYYFLFLLSLFVLLTIDFLFVVYSCFCSFYCSFLFRHLLSRSCLFHMFPLPPMSPFLSFRYPMSPVSLYIPNVVP